MEVKKCVPRQVSFTIGKAGRLGKTFGKVFYWDDLAKVRGPNTSWKWPKLRVRLFEVMNDRAIPFPVTMTTGNITYIPGDLNEASHPRLRTSQMFVFFQFFDSIFLKVLQLQSPETQTKTSFLNAKKKQPSGCMFGDFLKAFQQIRKGFSNRLRPWIFSHPSSEMHRSGSGSFRIYAVVIHVNITQNRSHAWSLCNTPNLCNMSKGVFFFSKPFAVHSWKVKIWWFQAFLRVRSSININGQSG